MSLMSSVVKPATALAVLLVLTACQTAAPGVTAVADTAPTSSHANLNSVLWYQTSAEFRANSIQTYNQARALLTAAKADRSWTAWPQNDAAAQLPPAIIVDIDETILDNSPSAARDVLNNQQGFDEQQWDNWVAAAKAQAVPGAVAFVNAAEAMGIKVLYISNRACKARDKNSSCPQKADTIRNLRAVGIQKADETQVWIKGEQPDWSSEKQSRRELAMQQYRVIMSVGDDFGDFLPNVKKDITPAQRAALVDQYQTHWGTKWFMLPNPTYGSWETILAAPKQQYLQGF